MKMKWLLVCLCLLSTDLLAKKVTFATFNVYWLYDDKPPMENWWSNQRGKKGQTYEQALTLVADAIINTKSDVIAIQEIESLEVLKKLNNQLRLKNAGYKYWWISRTGDDFTGQNVAILSQYPKAKNSKVTTAYPNEEAYYLTENDRGNEDVTGLSKALRVDLSVNKSRIRVFVFHLKSQSGGSVSDQKRLAQATIVRRLTAPLLSDGKSVIVMGDLNADRGSPSLLRIRGFDDIYTDLYQSVHSPKFTGDKWTYKFRGRTKQLDHILLSNNLRQKIVSGQINYDHDYRTSDHFPVILTLDI